MNFMYVHPIYLGFIEGNGIAEPYPDDISWVSPAVSPALRILEFRWRALSDTKAVPRANPIRPKHRLAIAERLDLPPLPAAL